MRIVLFISIWVLTFFQGVQAQNNLEIWSKMETYLIENQEREVPDEKQLIENLILEAESQGDYDHDYEKLQSFARRAYWQKSFLKENRDRISEVKRMNGSYTETAALVSSGSPVPNPSIPSVCGIDIVVVVDRSGSISGVEQTNILAGLATFLTGQLGSGNSVTFVGMGSINAPDPAISSPTLTYDPGVSQFFHLLWLNNFLFTGTSTSDSWSTGLALANNFSPDLVLVITDGATGFNDRTLACAAANTLKQNGAHLFVLAQDDDIYQGGTLADYVMSIVDANAVMASSPPTAAGILNSDYIGFDFDGFAALGTWLGALDPVIEGVEIANVWPRECVVNNFEITGNTMTCDPNTGTLLELRFLHNGVLVLTVEADLNSNGSWSYSASLGELLGLGLNHDTWYDVVPVFTTSNGSIYTGDEFIAGLNNDFYTAAQSDPVVIINDDPNDFTTSMTRICDGSPIYYHGTDPLSGNHHSSIKRKPSNSSGDFGEWRGVGGLGVSLDGYTGDLIAQYPGYFMVGYTYQLKISTYNHDPDVCIAWTEEYVEFEIVDCCNPDFILVDVPDCVEDDVPFTVRVEILAPLTEDDILDLYSQYPNFSGGDFTVVSANGSSLIIDITFTSENCTCEGEMLVFDIIFDCGGIWVMTEKLPCCAEPCKETSIVDWSTEDCIIVNGKPARKFCLEVNSQAGFTGVLAGGNDSPCQVELEDLEVTNVSPGVYTVCGYMVFSDPDCTFHAEVSLIMETEYGCCTISQSFSFPGDCVPPEGCTETVPNIEIIFGTGIHVSLGLPTGAHVIVTDVINGSSTGHIVGNVECGPFVLSPTGSIISSNICNGIILPGQRGVDCRPTETNPEPSFPYHFVITYGECTWVLIGDYCDEFIVYPVGPNDGDATRSTEGEAVSSLSDQVRVFPNPVDQSGVLNFDLGKTNTNAQEVSITDISGRTIESFLPASGQKVFQHRLSQPLVHGIYFAIIRFDDGTLSSTKLVAIE